MVLSIKIVALVKQDINENRQSISAPPYRTGMLIGDTSRQHYSRERRQAGHKSYEGNNNIFPVGLG
jgi:hypothetical protein